MIEVSPEVLAAIDNQTDRQVRAWARLELYTSPVVTAVYVEKTSLEGSEIVKEIYGTSRRSISVNPSALYSPLIPSYSFTQGRGLFDRVDDFPFGGVARLFGLPGVMPLDGSYAVFDDMEAAGVGLWIRDNSPVGYTYSVAIEFSEAVDVDALTIVFDRLTQEYGTVDIWLSDMGENHLEGGRFGGEVETVAEITADGVGRINIRPVDWMNDEYEYTRISEIYFGRIKLFGPNDILSLDVSEPISPLTDDIPSPEIRLTVSDPDNLFNPINLTGTAWLLERDMSVRAGIIVDGYHVGTWDMGLHEWDVSTRGQVSFTLRPRLFMATEKYSSPSMADDALEDVIADIVSYVPGLNVTIDDTLKSVVIGQQADGLSISQALHQASQAAGGWVKNARDGTCQILPISFTGDGVYTYARDNAFQDPRPVQRKKIRMAVVHWYPKNEGDPVSIEFEIQAPSGEGRLGVRLVYKDGKIYDAIGDWLIGSGRDVDCGAFMARLKGDDAFNGTISGNKTEITDYAVELDGGGNAADEERELSNPFVRNETQATAVGNLLIDWANRRLELQLYDRGAVHVEPGDVVTVETEFGDLDVLITEQSLTFQNNFLRGGAVGVVRVGT